LEVQEVSDRLEISEVLYRYGHALDSRDWDMLREQVFAPDAVADFLAHGIKDGVEEIVELIAGVLTGLDVSQHLIATPIIDLEGDRATSRCYLQAQHVFEGAPGGDQFIVAGTYVDELERRDNGWRIVKRGLEASWVAGNAEVFTAAAERYAANR